MEVKSTDEHSIFGLSTPGMSTKGTDPLTPGQGTTGFFSAGGQRGVPDEAEEKGAGATLPRISSDEQPTVCSAQLPKYQQGRLN